MITSQANEENHIVILIETEKILTKFNTHSWLKSLCKLIIEGNLFKTYKNPTANTILKSEKREAFSPRSGMRQGYPFSPLLFKIVPEVLSNLIREEKEVKGIQFGEEETKLCSQVTWYLYKKSKKNWWKKPPRTIKW